MIEWEDRHKNFDRVKFLLAEAGPNPGDLIVLPEMFDSGFSLNTKRTADSENKTLGFLRDLAIQTECTVQGGRTVLQSGQLATNTAPVFSPTGSQLAEYAKIHPFSFGREPEAFQAGNEIVTYPWGELGDGTGGLTVCPAICYDLRFPELFRLGLLKGAQMFAIGANWPAARAEHWRALLIARAIENQAFVLGVNRTGSDPYLQYRGGTIAIGPKGDVLGELGDEQAVLSVDIDSGEVAEWRKTFPAWQDLRLIGPGGD